MSIANILAQRQAGIVSCRLEESVKDVACRLAEQRIGALPVLEEAGDQEGQVLGIFSERDLLYAIARDGAAALALRVADVMTSPAITIAPEADALEALAMMTRRRIRHLPVVREGRMIGFVSIGDLVKHRMEKIEAEAEQMRVYISMA